MGKKEYSEVIDSSVSKPFLKSKDQTLLQEKKKSMENVLVFLQEDKWTTLSIYANILLNENGTPYAILLKIFFRKTTITTDFIHQNSITTAKPQT